VWARTLFLGLSTASFWFSLLPSKSLVRCFIPREALIGAATLFVVVFLAIGFGDAPSLTGTGGGRAVNAGRVGFGFGGSSDFDRRSPMVVLRRTVGILLMRISTRERRCCAWTLYCARSLRARSVSSSCRLSIRACFCSIESPILRCFLIGLDVAGEDMSDLRLRVRVGAIL